MEGIGRRCEPGIDVRGAFKQRQRRRRGMRRDIGAVLIVVDI